MRYVFLTFFLLSSLFAFEKVDVVLDQIINQRENYFQTSTPFKISPKVNPITGDLIEEEIDLVVAGVEPLSVRRFYNHTGIYEPRYGGWRYNPEAYLVANFELTSQERFAAAGNFDGSIAGFKAGSTPYLWTFNLPKGFSHLSANGQTHPLNTKVTYYKVGDRKDKTRFAWAGQIVDGSGAKSSFGSNMHCWLSNIILEMRRRGRDIYVKMYTPDVWTPFQMIIQETKLPNGNILCYTPARWKDDKEYPRPYLINTITAYNADKTKILGFIKFQYDQDKHGDVKSVRAVGSDERQVFIQHQGSSPILLNTACPPDKPAVSYGYQKQWINRVERPEGRVITTEYNATGKVAAQYAPVGPQGEMHPIGRYIYHDKDTEVFDAEGNKTVYRFNENKQISALEIYQRDKLYRVDRFTWDEANGDLLRKVTEDGLGKVIQISEYAYDKNHNPIQERIGDGRECHTITRTFSDDGFNLKLSESDRKGKLICYKYLPATNLLTSAFVCEGSAIRQRSFYVYDDCAACIKTIIDDGSTEDLSNLEGITYRKITAVTPKQTTPCYGLPEVVEEKTLDSLGNEILLHKTIYSYTAFGKVLKEEHFDANNVHCYSLQNSYDEKERLILMSDPLGKVTSFSYDANNNLISISGPRQDQYKEITYDKANRPIRISDWQTDGSVLTTEKRYDRLGQVIAEIDACGHETLFEFDSTGKIISVHHPDGSTERKEYDAFGNVTKLIEGEGYETRTSYDFHSKPLSIYHPDGKEEHFVYYPNGTIASYIDKNGSKHIYQYDIFDHLLRTDVYSSSGQLLKVITSVYTPFCKLSETDGEGITTAYTYDFCGRKIAEMTDTKEVLYSYDALGHLSETDEHDFQTAFEYDHLGQIIAKGIHSGSELQFQEKYGYDEAGNQNQCITSHGVFETLHNTSGKPISERNPLGFVTTHEYLFGKEHSKITTDANGIKTIRIYDSRGRQAEVFKQNREGETLSKHINSYDKNGNLIEQAHCVFDGIRPTYTLTHRWEYGPLGRLESFIEAGEKETKYLFTSRGQLATIIKPSAIQFNHEWDALGRLSRYFSSDFDYRYTYDRNDRLLSVYDTVSKNETTRSYDALGNIVQETLASGIHLINTYEPQGKRVSLTLPDGSTINYAYNGSCLYSITRNGMKFTYQTRDLEGHLTLASLPNQLGNISIERDALSRWKTFDSPFFHAQFPHEAYDSVGNLLCYQYRDHFGEIDCVYTYDDLSQLASELEHSYHCDSIQNRLQKDDILIQVNTLCQIIHDGNIDYQYDADGNLIFDGFWHYFYDSQDRLIALENSNKRIVYEYDPFHRRLSRRVFANSKEISFERYLWDGDHEIGTLDEQGKLKELRILGEGLGAEIGAAVLYELSGKTYMPIHDHRGCVVALADATTGKPVNHYRYTAFGEELTTDTLSPWRFSSKRVEPETGLVFFGRRYYHPRLGRWITQDPQGYDDGPNLYAYLNNCPLADFDSYGLWSWRGMWGNARYFMWGMLEGSSYHFSNMASSFCTRDLSNPGWQPRSLYSNHDLAIPSYGLDKAEKTFLPFTYEARRMSNEMPQNDLMRARGRAWGEQAVTFGGLFSAVNAGKGLLDGSFRLSKAVQVPIQKSSREYLFSGKPAISAPTFRGRNHLKPDLRAEGAHSVFRRDANTGRVSHYETYRPQTNPFDPKPWESVIRYDAAGKSHLNKYFDRWIETPHTHDPYYPGGVRLPYRREVPK